jgi:hypothetical protein
MPDVGPYFRRGISSILYVIGLILKEYVSIGLIVGAIVGHSINL